MLDLKLIDADWDLSLLGDGSDLQLVASSEQTVQHIKQRLLTFYQEWFLDLSIGIPWFQQILEKPASLAMVEVILQKAIRESPEVKSLTSFIVTAGDTERSILVNFTVLLESGSETSTVELEV